MTGEEVVASGACHGRVQAPMMQAKTLNHVEPSSCVKDT